MTAPYPLRIEHFATDPDSYKADLGLVRPSRSGAAIKLSGCCLAERTRGALAANDLFVYSFDRLEVVSGDVIAFADRLDSNARFGGRITLTRDELERVELDNVIEPGEIPLFERWANGIGVLDTTIRVQRLNPKKGTPAKESARENSGEGMSMTTAVAGTMISRLTGLRFTPDEAGFLMRRIAEAVESRTLGTKPTASPESFDRDVFDTVAKERDKLKEAVRVLEKKLSDALAAETAAADAKADPIPMRLPCPACGALHVDRGDFLTKPHHTHACQHCGHLWRPAIVPTRGVVFLPGCHDIEHAADATELAVLADFYGIGEEEVAASTDDELRARLLELASRDAERRSVRR